MALSPQPHQVLAKIAHIENVVSVCRDKICHLTANHTYLTSKLKGLEEDIDMKLHNMDTQIDHITNSKRVANSRESVESCEKRLMDKMKLSEEGMDRKVDAHYKELTERHDILKKDIEDRVEQIQSELATVCKEATNDINERKAADDARIQRHRRKQEKDYGIVSVLNMPSTTTTASNETNQILFTMKKAKSAFHGAANGGVLLKFYHKFDHYGYNFFLQVLLNGSQGFWSWNKAMGFGIVFPKDAHNVALSWPITRKASIDIICLDGEVLPGKVGKTFSFRTPGGISWINGVFNLDTVFGKKRDFQTKYVEDDTITFAVTMNDS